MSRNTARDSAFKIIYQVPFHEEGNIDDVVENYIKCEEYIALAESGALTKKDIEYVKTCVSACFENMEYIDSKVSSSLKNWTLERISRVNLAILRLAISEMEYADVPFQVSINEAVELAKKYSDDESPAFVNGVLADIVG